MQLLEGIDVRGPVTDHTAGVLTPDALAFVARLEREFRGERRALLARRTERQARLDAGELPDFLPETRHIREREWSVAPTPAALADRRVEITGPVDAKMILNALNSGARMFMADFEDATSPTWQNLTEGQANLVEAVAGTLEFHNPDGRVYRPGEQTATLLVRPRGWHLDERHVVIDGQPVSGSLFDFGLYFYHNARPLLEAGKGPYFYLPKLESHLEARLWNQVFEFAQDTLGIGRGSIKATVLIETILAAFEMDEILYELREHSAGLNAGRWDYIFSVIKKLGRRPEFLLPDRVLVTMTVPFMRAYAELLVQTCHRRGAHAIGGMAAFIPSRRDPAVNEIALARVREDKQREAGQGYDGTWVAHPDLVPTALAEFDRVLGDRPNQVDRQRPDVTVSAADLLNVRVPNTSGLDDDITDFGLRTNVSIGIQYIASWLRGTGAAAIDNLMEDAATAEISRAQVWQWVHLGQASFDGGVVTPDFVRGIIAEELSELRQIVGAPAYHSGRYEEAARIFEQVALGDPFVEFLTLVAYDAID